MHDRGNTDMAEIMMPVRVLDEKFCETCPNLDIHVEDYTCLYAGNELVTQKFRFICKNITLCGRLRKKFQEGNENDKNEADHKVGIL